MIRDMTDTPQATRWSRTMDIRAVFLAVAASCALAVPTVLFASSRPR